MEFSMVLVMSVLIEAVITYAKTWVVDRKIKWQMIAAVVVSIAISFAYGLDIPALVGFESGIPFMGNILTGILISRGSNYIYDLIKTIRTKKTEPNSSEDKEVKI